jgi:hypothetical protein
VAKTKLTKIILLEINGLPMQENVSALPKVYNPPTFIKIPAAILILASLQMAKISPGLYHHNYPEGR